MRKFILKFWPILFIATIWFVFSSPFFIKGLAPYPSYFQSSFFSPWSDYSIYEGPVKNNAMPDIITQIYPWRVFTIESLKSFEIPLWNPYSFAGTPHLANYQSAALFPLNIIFFLPVSFITSWSLLVLLQPLIAGLGIYLFARSLKRSQTGSLLASISFMFCGFIVSWMGYGTLAYAISFLPFVLWGVNKFLETKKSTYGLVISLSVFLSLLSGHFQTSIYLLFALFAYVVFEGVRNKDKKNFLVLLTFFLIGLMLSMPQILPSLEFYLHSARQEIITQLEVIPLMYLPTLFAPDFFGNPVTRNDWFGHYAEWNAYAGVIPLLLALFGSAFAWIKDKRVLFFVILAIFSLLMAFETPINQLFFELKLPFFSTSASSRIIVLFSFSVAVLSAFGLDFLVDRIKTISLKKIVTFFGVGLLVLVALWIVPTLELLEDSEKNFIAQNNLILPTLIFIAFSGLLFILYVFRKRKIAVFIFLAGVILVTSADMLRFSSKWMPFNPQDLIYPEVPIAEFASSEFDNKSRGYGNYGAEAAFSLEIPHIEGYDPLYISRYGEFIKAAEDGNYHNPDRSVVTFSNRGEYADRVLNFLGVKYLIHKIADGRQSWVYPFWEYPVDNFVKIYEGEAYEVYENHRAYERVFIPSSYEVVSSDREIINSVYDANIDLRETAILEKDININPSSGSARITNYSPNEIMIEADASGEALLILSDPYYPGWKAEVNGNDVEVLRTNYAFRGVVIPEGKSNISFTYSPDSFKSGIALFVTGMLGALLLLYLSRGNKNK